MNYEFDVGFVGSGNIAFALAQGIISGNSTVSILAADPWRLTEKSEKWENLSKSLKRTTDNDEVLKKCRIIILSIKPQLFKAVVEKLNKTEATDQVIVSVIAGVSLATLKRDFPCMKYHVRIMCNTTCTIQQV